MAFKAFLALFFIPFALLAIATNNVDAEVQWNSIYANTPYIVTISVTHDSNETIDTTSFTADNKIISPKLIKTVKIEPHSSPLEISIYNLEMPGLPQGLQTLPTFRVKIGEKFYTSGTTGFEVQGSSKGVEGSVNVPAAPPQASQLPTLKLQAVFTGTDPVYPGQRFYLGYRYLYNTSIDLSSEILPLIEAKGFKKIGDKQIDNLVDMGMTVTQVVQKVEADRPGNFTFPISEIAGYAYTLNAAGQKQYIKTPLASSLNAVQIKVMAFPEKDKPASFRGAIGSYSIQAKLVGTNQLEAGDKIQLLLTITGKGELDQLLPPDLCCQPGFSGYFKPSDLPPETAIKGDAKTFLIDLYVENPAVSFIPPIEFSFFNPISKTYEKSITEKISLKVSSNSPLFIPKEVNQADLTPVEASLFFSAPTGSYTFPLLSIGLIGVSLLVLQAHFLKQKETEEKKLSIPLSQSLYQSAIKEQFRPEMFYPLALQALRQKLFEDQVIAKSNVPLDLMPESGLKTLLKKIEDTRFSKDSLWGIPEATTELNRIFTT